MIDLPIVEFSRLLKSPTPSGQTKVDCELVGNPSDPMYKKRAAIFGPLGKRIADAMQVFESQKGVFVGKNTLLAFKDRRTAKYIGLKLS